MGMAPVVPYLKLFLQGFFPSIKAETRLAMSSLLANVGTCELEKPERIALFTPLLDQLVEVIQDKSAKV